jgi:hypothetical protein
MDVSRYADTKGYVFTSDRSYPFAYTYRDYLVRAFNEDLPYDQFIREQLAAEDQAFRERRRLFNWRLIPEDTYNRVYRGQSLDPYSALEAARRAGVLTPSAPPER